jgi:hypothetical protein
MQAAQGNNNQQTSNTYASEQKQNLTEAAAEIQQLLEQLSQSYPTNTITNHPQQMPPSRFYRVRCMKVAPLEFVGTQMVF